MVVTGHPSLGRIHPVVTLRCRSLPYIKVIDRIELSLLHSSEAMAIAAIARSLQDNGGPAVRFRTLGDGVLVALGRDRYVNRAIGIGPSLTWSQLDEIDAFYADAGLPAAVQLSALADAGTLDRLAKAGYRARWFRQLRAAPVSTTATDRSVMANRAMPGEWEITVVGDDEIERWLDVFAIGTEAGTAATRAVGEQYCLAARRVAGWTAYLASKDGEAVGCGAIHHVDGVAWLSAAATIPSYRNQGVQTALLDHRIAAASIVGCSAVAATAVTGVSARNLSKAGLVLVDSQLVFSR